MTISGITLLCEALSKSLELTTSSTPTKHKKIVTNCGYCYFAKDSWHIRFKPYGFPVSVGVLGGSQAMLTKQNPSQWLGRLVQKQVCENTTSTCDKSKSICPHDAEPPSDLVMIRLKMAELQNVLQLTRNQVLEDNGRRPSLMNILVKLRDDSELDMVPILCDILGIDRLHRNQALELLNFAIVYTNSESLAKSLHQNITEWTITLSGESLKDVEYKHSEAVKRFVTECLRLSDDSNSHMFTRQRPSECRQSAGAATGETSAETSLSTFNSPKGIVATRSPIHFAQHEQSTLKTSPARFDSSIVSDANDEQVNDVENASGHPNHVSFGEPVGKMANNQPFDDPSNPVNESKPRTAYQETQANSCIAAIAAKSQNDAEVNCSVSNASERMTNRKEDKPFRIHSPTESAISTCIAQDNNERVELGMKSQLDDCSRELNRASSLPRKHGIDSIRKSENTQAVVIEGGASPKIVSETHLLSHFTLSASIADPSTCSSSVEEGRESVFSHINASKASKLSRSSDEIQVTTAVSTASQNELKHIVEFNDVGVTFVVGNDTCNEECEPPRAASIHESIESIPLVHYDDDVRITQAIGHDVREADDASSKRLDVSCLNGVERVEPLEFLEFSNVEVAPGLARVLAKGNCDEELESSRNTAKSESLDSMVLADDNDRDTRVRNNDVLEVNDAFSNCANEINLCDRSETQKIACSSLRTLGIGKEMLAIDGSSTFHCCDATEARAPIESEISQRQTFPLCSIPISDAVVHGKRVFTSVSAFDGADEGVSELEFDGTPKDCLVATVCDAEEILVHIHIGSLETRTDDARLGEDLEQNVSAEKRQRIAFPQPIEIVRVQSLLKSTSNSISEVEHTPLCTIMPQEAVHPSQTVRFDDVDHGAGVKRDVPALSLESCCTNSFLPSQQCFQPEKVHHYECDHDIGKFALDHCTERFVAPQTSTVDSERATPQQTTHEASAKAISRPMTRMQRRVEMSSLATNFFRKRNVQMDESTKEIRRGDYVAATLEPSRRSNRLIEKSRTSKESKKRKASLSDEAAQSEAGNVSTRSGPKVFSCRGDNHRKLSLVNKPEGLECNPMERVVLLGWSTPWATTIAHKTSSTHWERLDHKKIIADYIYGGNPSLPFGESIQSALQAVEAELDKVPSPAETPESIEEEQAYIRSIRRGSRLAEKEKLQSEAFHGQTQIIQQRKLKKSAKDFEGEAFQNRPVHYAFSKDEDPMELERCCGVEQCDLCFPAEDSGTTFARIIDAPAYRQSNVTDYWREHNLEQEPELTGFGSKNKGRLVNMKKRRSNRRSDRSFSRAALMLLEMRSTLKFLDEYNRGY